MEERVKAGERKLTLLRCQHEAQSCAEGQQSEGRVEEPHGSDEIQKKPASPQPPTGELEKHEQKEKKDKVKKQGQSCPTFMSANTKKHTQTHTAAHYA